MKKSNVLNKIFLLATSFHTVLLGIVFVIQVLRIYYFNEKNFTREICGQYILEILPVLIIWVLLIIGSFIYFNITNFKYKNISKISYVTRKTNLERICPEIKDHEIRQKLNKIKRNNIIGSIIVLLVVLISIYMGLSYLLNINHFVPDGTADDLIKQAINMSMHLMPWCIISFGVFIGFTFYVEYSAKKTTEILLQVIKTEGKVTKEELKENNIGKYIAQGAILIIAVVFIVIGVANGGAADVLQKAVNICRECIGIG